MSARALLRRAAVSAAALLALAASRAEAQQRPALRFPVTAVGDSTFVFRAGGGPGVAKGVHGAVVDPAHHDALVAHFRVLSVVRGDAIALITGQMTDVTTEHVAVLDAPRTPWYRARAFWVGLVLGIGGGVAAAAASR